jgi:hypothetical protein
MIRCVAALLWLVPLAAGAAPARPLEPHQVVSAFCREDALGARTAPRRFARVAPLVGWPLEPAWDHVVLIQGYEIGDPQQLEPGLVEVPVTYTVVGRLSANRKDAESHLSQRVYRVALIDGSWRLTGAPPPPHLFANRVEAEPVQQGLQGADGYLSQSRFVAEIVRAGGWTVPMETVVEMLAGATWGPVRQPQPGDLAVFFDGDLPYHVGIVEAPGRVVSATLTAGVVRSTLATFSGRVRYLRLRQP